MPNIITITGPSRAGKSTTVNYLLGYHKSESFQPERIKKYTTRQKRSDQPDNEVICRCNIPKRCDVIYEQYGDRYGLDRRKLSKSIKSGRSPIIILNDVRAIEDIRYYFGELVKSIFIYRDNPTSPEYRDELISTRGDAGIIRFEKAATIFRIYIENIHLFDHVIINTSSLANLELQVRKIADGMTQMQNWPLRGGL